MPGLKYWDTSSNGYILLTPGATTFPLTYMQTLTAPLAASSPYQINHNLNTTTPLVQAWDATTGGMVNVAVRVVNSNSIQISVTANAPNNINVIVMGTAQSPVPVAPGDYANKAYVDARTPNLPAAVTSGTTIQSFTDALGDVWVALNGVNSGAWRRARDVLHTRWYRNAALTLAAGTWTTIPWDTVTRDTYSLYVSAQNGYVLPVPGYYQLNCHIAWTGVVSSNYFGINAVVGGTSADQAYGTYGSTASGTDNGLVSVFYVSAASTLVIVQLTANVATVSVAAGQPQRSYCEIDYLGTG